MYASANVRQGAAPIISSFSASPLNPASQGCSAVTLSWNSTTASYFIVSPQVGAIRGTAIVVAPSQTTTYALYATNQFGRTTAALTITVQ
jgi:hypothetical protein